jgi:hypothetical protein
MAVNQKVVYVDFDGVLNSYQTPFDGLNLPDPPIPGALEWLEELTENFRVFIYTTRMLDPGAEHAIVRWLNDNGLPMHVVDRLGFTALKRGAHVYIDDRVIPYRGGQHPSVEEIANFKPWTKQ